MRQVPHYLLIGQGRVACHFQYYFHLLSISFETWNRRLPLEDLQKKLTHATHILLLISDSAIESFITQYLKDTQALCIHFSGSLVSDCAFGAHPLLGFTNKNPYEFAQYKAIPFVLDHDAPLFENMLPGLPNSHVRLNKALKPKYHALCVLSGNLSCLLWQKLFSSFETEFNLPASTAIPYLIQQTHNLKQDYKSALTGPLVRGDTMTLEKNLDALNQDPFQVLYQGFISCYQQLKKAD